LSIVAREITADEVLFYEQCGWVKLDGFLDRELVGELLQVAEEITASTRSGFDGAPEVEGQGYAGFRDFGRWFGLASERAVTAVNVRFDPFPAVSSSKELGRAMQRLFNRTRLAVEDVGVSTRGNAVAWLAPNEPERDPGFHQDLRPEEDRSGRANMWVALDEVVPEQAAMRFLTGSHREGPLGIPSPELLERYPKLTELYPVSPPLHYLPGDVTVHHRFLVHGTPANRTDRPRRSAIFTYMPSDVTVEDSPDGWPPPVPIYP
jgi:hypothetical protein